MEVLREHGGFLSNYEVYSMLCESQETLSKVKGPTRGLENLATIAYETTKYLAGTACRVQSPTVIETFLAAVAPFELTKAEKLQILNLRPTTPVEISLIVEESDRRLSEERVEELLQVVRRTLPDPNPEGERGDNEETDRNETT
ncbi:DNA-directed RNA polymerase III subunit RPC9-like [Oscarella lobularis]|uniref:DNA-directed RNA polymerase III subunit RPC9-like n=1 Tax=Oscarella lobularis TaxID=121494 RepID=UPI0033143A85